MQVHDEVTHMGIVDGLLRLRLPGRIGAGIVRIDADDIEFAQVAEFGTAGIVQFAAENEMRQLLVGSGHNSSVSAQANSGMRSRNNASRATWRAGPAATSAPCL